MSADETPDAGQDPGPAQGPGTTTTNAAREDKAAKKARRWAETKMDLKWATTLLFVLIIIGPVVFHYTGIDRIFSADPELTGPYKTWENETAGEEEMAKLATEIFAQDGLVVPFEVLSILLLAALIAGIVIAIREPEGGA